jgi:metallo-beta-lactamase class B
MIAQADIFGVQADSRPARADTQAARADTWTAQADAKSRKLTPDSHKPTILSLGPCNTRSMSRALRAAFAPLALATSPVCTAAPPAAPPLSDTASDTRGQQAWAAACSDSDGWDQPGPPFRIFGNSYYVGTCGIAAILITSPKGHVLIDSGTEKGADVVVANIRALGFKPTDVAVLLSSHEHYDHVGGLAKLQETTGARVFASPDAASVLLTGKDAPADPQYGMHPPMRPVARVGVIREGQKVRYNRDGLVLTPLFTPGHTPGATSWQWKSCVGQECRTIVFADSLSPVSSDEYKFSAHPGYLAAYRTSLAKLAATPCDILLTPHPSASGMREKLAKGALATPAPTSCRDYAKGIAARLDARIAKETRGG